MSMLAAQDIYAPVAAGMAETERVLAELVEGDTPAVKELFRHVNRFSGKRLRPALAHLSGGLVGETNDEHAKIGAIIESLHISSLLHDDVLDEADTRRRVPTLNSLHGNEIPVLLGDILYSRAFALALRLSTLDAAHELAWASEAICRGEIEQSFLRFQIDVDEEPYFQVIRDKTATLYGVACKLGARYAGGDEETCQTLRRFGFELGMAFQIIDDCLDLVGDERIVGKSLGTDLETGKITLPVIRLAQRLEGEDATRLRSLLGDAHDGRRRDALAEAFDLVGIVNDCQAEANGFLERCVRTLQPFEDGPEKQSLQAICEFVLSREH